MVLTCREPFDRADERLSPRLRQANLAAGLRQAASRTSRSGTARPGRHASTRSGKRPPRSTLGTALSGSPRGHGPRLVAALKKLIDDVAPILPVAP